MTPAAMPPFPENRVIREGERPNKTKPKKPSVTERVRPVLVAALFWYVLLVVVGASCMAVGVSLVFGVGYGLIAFGTLVILGSEIVRAGMTRG